MNKRSYHLRWSHRTYRANLKESPQVRGPWDLGRYFLIAYCYLGSRNPGPIFTCTADFPLAHLTPEGGGAKAASSTFRGVTERIENTARRFHKALSAD